MSSIEEVVSELIELSNNNRININNPTDDFIVEYEKKLKLKFLKEYKYFLKNASTIIFGVLEPLIISNPVIDESIELSIVLNEATEMGVPYNWLPICEDNGDYYCLLESGIVRFWSHNGISDESWDNLASWVKKVWIDEE